MVVEKGGSCVWLIFVSLWLKDLSVESMCSLCIVM